ncbi:beta-ketoacyl synthase N-terminal-like domain-containing protein [Aquimarina sp. RZ0]|uniref:beta-ketoacyl synthase N-terminal-like domain-containing protein n=1 Tax=Aquimarina sp. RZ0 TaxID=2607730 RepID=UPI00165FFC81|nr:beta-ketoacyl synthase N-terminal-like domain-containing protein [Aquimarina sp. RZ0]
MTNNIVVTGMGVITPIGIGLDSFSEALRKETANFSTISFEKNAALYKYPIAKIVDFDFRKQIEKINLDSDLINKAKKLRHISKSNAFGIYCALEAWNDSGLTRGFDLTRIAIVSCGSNTQQSTLQDIQEKYADKLQFLNPNYGLNFFDTDLIGILSELLGVKGEGHSISAASASGNMGIIQGSRLIASNEYDVVIVVAPLMDISLYEYQGFTALGAMSRIEKNSKISNIYRPFDDRHNGFVYGQSAGCLILESKESVLNRGGEFYGSIEGYGINLDANRNPNPSKEGEQKAMQSALKNAGICSKQIDYVNTHGSGSIVGDLTEVEALLSIGLENVKANSTKSLIGHSLSASGLVESIASLIQIQEGFLHPTHNLEKAISDDIDWIKNTPRKMNINYAMNNSFGFGGINTSIIIKK